MTLSVPNLLAARRASVERCAARLPHPAQTVAAARQAVTDRAHRLLIALPRLVAARRAALVEAERHLPPPAGLLAARRSELALAAAHLRAGLRQAVAGRAALAGRVLPRLSDAPVRARLREAHARLEGLAARLESVSYHAVLARGFAAVFDASDHPVTTAAAVKPGMALRITFADGDARATAVKPADKRQGALPL